MFRLIVIAALAAMVAAPALSTGVSANDISGSYLEARTCDVYTGPCFANSEVGLTGMDAIMAWNIEQGEQQGVQLAGLNVVVVLRASETLGFLGIDGPAKVKSVILVDQRADARQREALIAFAKQRAGRAGEDVARIESAPIEMSVDTKKLIGNLKAGNEVKLVTRKAHHGDHICGNESKYYPPLASVDRFDAGVTLEGKFSGSGLGTRWSMPNSRTSYVGTFSY